jgi:hypothetical protein
LPAGVPLSQERIGVVAKASKEYVRIVNTGSTANYEVPQDGRVMATIQSSRGSCGIYLFNLVRVGGDDDPLKKWSLSVTRNGKILKKLSLRRVRELAMDDTGYHLLRIRD